MSEDFDFFIWLLPKPRCRVGSDSRFTFSFMCCPVRCHWVPLMLPGCWRWHSTRGTRGMAGRQMAFSVERAGLWAQVISLALVRQEPSQSSVGGQAEACWCTGEGCSICRCSGPESLQSGPMSAVQTDLKCKQALRYRNLFIISSQVPRGTWLLQLMDKGGERWVWNRAAVEHHKFLMFKEQTLFLSICLSPPASVGRTEQ